MSVKEVVEVIEKEKNEKLDCRKKKLFSLIVADLVYGHIRTKGIKKAAPKEVL